MLLMSPSDAAQAIGSKCGGCADADYASLTSILNLLTPKVEAACNVYSLTRGEYTEAFEAACMPRGGHPRSELTAKLSLRLSNGFVLKDEDEPVVITDPEGTVVDSTSYPDTRIEIDYGRGMIHLDEWIRGVYTVTYQSGFEPTELPDPAPVDFDPDTRVLQDIPLWMKSIVVMYLDQWYRAVYLSTRASKEMSFIQVSEALRRMVHSAVYGTYQRPRMGCVWGDIQ